MQMAHNGQATRKAAHNAVAVLGIEERGLERAQLVRKPRFSIVLPNDASVVWPGVMCRGWPFSLLSLGQPIVAQ